jgi:hypothetical protein
LKKLQRTSYWNANLWRDEEYLFLKDYIHQEMSVLTL